MGTPIQEPCPALIIHNVGWYFTFGAVGGAAFHFPKGIYNTPKGERLIGGIQAIRMNAPRVGGRFAAWWGLLHAFECTMGCLRQKDDPWNSIIAGAATGGFFKIRRGLGAVSRSAVFFGGIFALIEGGVIKGTKMLNSPQRIRGQLYEGNDGTPIKEPCPNRILTNIGGDFVVGALNGAAFHFLKGIYNSPKGERLIGGIQAIRMNSPRVEERFDVWFNLFNAFECTMGYLRQKEDPWNPIIAGVATEGFLKMHRGLGVVSWSVVFFGGIVDLIEGAGIRLNKIVGSPQMRPPMPNVTGGGSKTNFEEL